MGKSKWPVCEKCGIELRPSVCDKYYLSNGEALCEDCFIEQEQEFIANSPDQYAQIVGAGIYYTGGM